MRFSRSIKGYYLVKIQYIVMTLDNNVSLVMINRVRKFHERNLNGIEVITETLLQIFFFSTGENFPYRPHCKMPSTFDVKIHKMTLSKVGDFYNGGLWGKSSSVVQSN